MELLYTVPMSNNTINRACKNGQTCSHTRLAFYQITFLRLIITSAVQFYIAIAHALHAFTSTQKSREIRMYVEPLLNSVYLFNVSFDEIIEIKKFLLSNNTSIFSTLMSKLSTGYCFLFLC